jgi:hypothetical protein
MFLRVVRAGGGNGIKHEYVRLVEAFRDEKGKTQHRTIINLGRKDLLRTHLDLQKLTRLLHGEEASAPEAKGDDVGAVGAWDWGGMLAVQKMWSDLGLHVTLDKAAKAERRDGTRLSDRALALVANRLMAPGSEHALARWLESISSVIGWVGASLPRGARAMFAKRVRRRGCGSRCANSSNGIALLMSCSRARTISSTRCLCCYATCSLLKSIWCSTIWTSTYFEGKGPPELGANGFSRDGKPRNVQVLVGLVMVDGWPIAHHVFQGNWRDAKTVPDVVRDLEQRFGLKRIVLVGDRGMATSQNIDQLKKGGHGYVVGRNRRRSGEVFDYIQSATGPWIECPVGISAGEKSTSPKTLVQEVTSNEPGVRVFVVHSDERLAYERAQRKRCVTQPTQRVAAILRALGISATKPPTPPQHDTTIL